jgi:hypothetical protein
MDQATVDEMWWNRFKIQVSSGRATRRQVGMKTSRSALDSYS